jgi:hypothetical protein
VEERYSGGFTGIHGHRENTPHPDGGGGRVISTNVIEGKNIREKVENLGGGCEREGEE